MDWMSAVLAEVGALWVAPAWPDPDHPVDECVYPDVQIAMTIMKFCIQTPFDNEIICILAQL